MKAGDVVTLKSGGPKMTILSASNDGGMVDVVYYDVNTHTFINNSFLCSALKKGK